MKLSRNSLKILLILLVLTGSILLLRSFILHEAARHNEYEKLGLYIFDKRGWISFIDMLNEQEADKIYVGYWISEYTCNTPLANTAELINLLESTSYSSYKKKILEKTNKRALYTAYKTFCIRNESVNIKKNQWMNIAFTLQNQSVVVIYQYVHSGGARAYTIYKADDASLYEKLNALFDTVYKEKKSK